MAQDGNDKLDIEIVGLVKNAKYSDVKGEIPPLFFRPYAQDESIGSAHFYVRTSLDEASILPHAAEDRRRRSTRTCRSTACRR